DREDAEKWGLLSPGEKITPNAQEFDDSLAASVQGLDDQMRGALKKIFGDQVKIEGDTAIWQGNTGAMPGLPPPEPPLDDTVKTGNSRITSDENDLQSLQSQDGAVEREATELRRLGEIAKGVFGEIVEGWDADNDLARGVQAQFAAGCLGSKPLYFDPWGSYSEEIVRALAGKLPEDVEVRAAKDHLFIYRPEAIDPILERDPKFYRPNGEDTWAAIERVSPAENGELLGYGCRSMMEGDVSVRIHAEDDPSRLFAGFFAHAETAEEWAAQRAREIALYTGESVVYTIYPR
ncbi:MAG TPA: hypothetical protein VK961_26925, partial [Chthoniobacter sp.]|nr:hypothetical protein [Chthoniobacter sp.]